jgi:hypothetical protein
MRGSAISRKLCRSNASAVGLILGSTNSDFCKKSFKQGDKVLEFGNFGAPLVDIKCKALMSARSENFV